MSFQMYVEVAVSDTQIAGRMADDEEFAANVLREIVETVPETQRLAEEIGLDGLIALEAFVAKLRTLF